MSTHYTSCSSLISSQHYIRLSLHNWILSCRATNQRLRYWTLKIKLSKWEKFVRDKIKSIWQIKECKIKRLMSCVITCHVQSWVWLLVIYRLFILAHRDKSEKNCSLHDVFVVAREVMKNFWSRNSNIISLTENSHKIVIFLNILLEIYFLKIMNVIVNCHIARFYFWLSSLYIILKVWDDFRASLDIFIVQRQESLNDVSLLIIRQISINIHVTVSEKREIIDDDIFDVIKVRN